MSERARAVSVSFILMAVLLAAPLAVAQTTNASIVGIVTDPSGGAVPGATITVTNAATKVSRSVTTNEVGAYTVVPLIPGRYEIKASSTGFRTRVQPEVVLETGAVVKVDFQLDIGAITESVEVTGAAPIMQTQEASVGAVVTTSQLERMPVNGRNFTRLLLLMPGTSDVPPGQQIGQAASAVQSTVAGLAMASVNGQRQQDNDYTIDGVDNNVMYKMSVTGAPPMDSIQEFRVATNNSAEYGRNAGANVNVSTKSGTRDLHGAVYEYLRNDKFDANDWFANRQGRGKVPFHQNQYGIAVGGPVYIPKIVNARESTFWFFNWEGFRYRRGNTLINSTPIAAERTGDFSMIGNRIYDPLTSIQGAGGLVRQPFAGNKIPQNRINPGMAYIVGLVMPLPNSGTGVSNNLLQTDATRNDRDYIVARGDRNIGTKDVIYGRYLRQRVGQTTPSGYAVRFNQIRIDVNNVGVGWTHTLSPTTVLEFRYGLNRPNSPNCDVYTQGITRPAALSKAGVTIFDPNAACGPLPNFSAVGQFNVGSGGGETVIDTDHQFDGKLSKMVGHHSLKMGAGYWLRNMDATFANPTNGYANFYSTLSNSADDSKSGDAFATLLLGYPSAIQRGLGIPFAQGRQKYTLAYFQDDWRVSSRLTVNLGARWDGYDRPHDAEDKLGDILVTRDPQTGKIQGQLMWAAINPLVDPVTGVANEGPHTYGYGRTLMTSRWFNFAPRVGIAYQINQKTVFRAGFGMFYNTTFMQELNDLRKMWPYLPQQLWNPNTGVIPDLSITDAGPSFSSTQALGGWPQDSNNRTPYSQQWNAFVQRELMQDMTLEVGYVGSANRDLVGYHEINSAYAPGPGAVDPRRIVQGFGSMVQGQNIFSAEYNSMQAKLTRRFSHGLQIMTNYTWGKSMDEQSALGTNYKYQDVHNRRADWSRSFYDIKHVFKIGYVYDLPFGRGRTFGANWSRAADAVLGGWALEGMAYLQSGQPVYIRTGVDQANIGGSYERPDVLRNPNLPVGQRTVDRWFDTSAFVLPKPYTFGNSGANIVDADGRQGIDLSIAKKFPVTEKQSVTFRGEFFNLPNHVNFALPGATLTAPASFGTITAATAARQIQFALRYTF
jgi:hypothetical protein